MRVLLAGWFSFDEVIATVNVSVVEQSARGLFDRVWERDAPGLACPDLAVEGRSRRCRWSRWRSRRCRRSTGSAARPSGSAARSRSGWPTARCPGSSWTCLYEKPHARRPAQVEALVRRADVVVSMRLHVLVLGLEHGRPVVACDPIDGGAKVTSQAAALDWPLVVPAEELTAHASTPLWSAACPVRWPSGCGRRGSGAGNARARAWFEEQLAG